MADLAMFCERLKDRLGLDNSYLKDDLPGAVYRYVTKLLRDYNFPKAIVEKRWEDIVATTQSYALPSYFKKEVAVFWYDDTDPTAAVSYSDPLRRREHFVMADPDGTSRYYWIIGTTLYTDITIDSGSAGINLIMPYLSLDPDDSISWILEDLNDILFTLCMYRLSAELGKPELYKMYQPLWAEDIKALAIYQNEIEYGNLDIVQRETTHRSLERYGTGT